MVLELKVLEEAHRHALLRFNRVANIPKIPNLTTSFDFKYRTVSFEEGVQSLLEGYQVVVACGGFYGDEGKGKLGNRVANICDLVVRQQGGENTGRSYIDKHGNKIVLHAIPSATGHGIPCLLNSEVVIDPISVMQRELEPLKTRGISLDNLMFGNCYVTTPGHRIMDVLGSVTNGSTGVGIKGIHASIRRKTALRLDDILATSEHLEAKMLRDMRTYEGFIIATPHLQDTAKVLEQLTFLQQKNPRVVPDHVLDFARIHHNESLESACHHLAQKYQLLVSNSPFENRVCARGVIQTALERGKRVLFEGTQGFFLANNYEVGHRDGTSSDTTASGILSGQGVNLTQYQPFVISIQKAPGTSRVGRGNVPFAFCGSNVLAEAGVTTLNELGDEICADFDFLHKEYFRNIGGNGIVQPFEYSDTTGTYNSGVAMAITSARELNEKGATTSKPRITGWFDCVAAAEVVRAQGENMFISAMDRGDQYDNIGLVVGYTVSLPEEVSAKLMSDSKGNYIDCNGTRYRTGHIVNVGDNIPNSEVLEYCMPIVRTMSGWKNNPLNTDNPNTWLNKELPQTVQTFIGTIEGLTGARILGIGIGPADHQAIYLQRT